MGNVYGYLCADYPLEQNCSNEITLAYYMRHSDFIRVIENRSEGTIRLNNGTGTVLLKADSVSISGESYEFGVSREEGCHINVIRKYIDYLAPGALILMTTIKELSNDSRAALYLYRRLMSRGIAVEFLDEPWLNTSIFTLARKEYSAADLIIQNIIQATFERETGNSYMEILSRTESNQAKKNGQSKLSGRNGDMV